MQSFLGVPIRVRDEVFGILYLAEKIDGPSFGEEDEDIVGRACRRGGVSIENAGCTRRRCAGSAGCASMQELTRPLLAGHSDETAFAVIARATRSACAASITAVAVPQPDGSLRVAGRRRPRYRGPGRYAPSARTPPA